jgi:Polyketide cyclase / dehydrase and lipid transport
MLDSRYLRRGRSPNRSEGWPHSRSSRRPRFGRLSEVRELRREIELDAPPERVWAVVTDFDAYPEWNRVRLTGRPNANRRRTTSVVLDGVIDRRRVLRRALLPDR